MDNYLVSVLKKQIAYLISVVKTVIHEPCNQRCFPNCKTNQQNQEKIQILMNHMH